MGRNSRDPNIQKPFKDILSIYNKSVFMAKTYRKNFARRRKARKRMWKKKKTSRLADKRINTLVEKRMKEIAVKECKKKVFKNWVFNTLGSYSATTRLITAERAIPSGTIGHYLLANQTNIGSLDFPDFRIQRQPIAAVEIQNPDFDDPLALLIHHRKSDTIYLSSIVFRGQLRLPSGGTGSDQVRLGLWQARLPAETPTLGRLNNSVYLGAQRPAGAVGYIETEQDKRESVKSQRLLKMKQWKLTNYEDDDRVVPFVFKHHFKRPVKIVYDDNDMSGSYPRNRFFWFAFTASGRNDDATNSGAASGYSPHVCCSVQLNYTESA